MFVVGVRVEERAERGVGAQTHMCRDGSRAVAPRAGVCLLNCVEFPASLTTEGGIGERCGEE